jgi:lipoprotein signal peptidase
MPRARLPVVIAVVVVADQAVKWWAWRHVAGVLINSGGYILLGPAVRSWFAHPVGGAVSDVLGAAALIAAGWWLARRPRPGGVLLGGGLVIGGWASNILDRLGLHDWTAPGSARGVVDFIPDGTPGRSNTADLCIVGGIVLLATTMVLRRDERPPPVSRRPGARAWIVSLIVLAAVITLAVTSAIDHEGRYQPDASGPGAMSGSRLARCLSPARTSSSTAPTPTPIASSSAMCWSTRTSTPGAAG